MEKINRRHFLKSLLRTAGSVPLLSVALASPVLSRVAFGDDLVELDPKDPVATALGYTLDATKVDLKKFPKRGGKEGAKQFCDNCSFYKKHAGKGEKELGTCTIFPNKLVRAKGWCNTWAEIPKKPSV